jgi:hypothetical protein
LPVDRQRCEPLDQLALNGLRRFREECPACRRHVEGDAPLVRKQWSSHNEAALDESPNYDGNRALMRRRSLGEVVQRIPVSTLAVVIGRRLAALLSKHRDNCRYHQQPSDNEGIDAELLREKERDHNRNEAGQRNFEPCFDHRYL